MRRRSPSHSDNNFAVPNNNCSSNNSNSQQVLSPTSDDLNANEPNDPDDSRPCLLSQSHSKLQSESVIRNNKKPGTTVAGEETTSPGKHRTNKKKHVSTSASSNLKLDLDISMAKAFSNSTANAVAVPRMIIPKNTSTPISTTSMNSNNIISTPMSKYSDSFMSSQSSYNSSSLSSFSTSSPSYHSFPFNSSSSYNNKLYHKKNLSNSVHGSQSSPSSARSKNIPKPITLKRYPHDPSSKESLVIDDVIEKLLKLAWVTKFF